MGGSITCSSGEFLDAALGGRSVKGATAPMTAAQKAKSCCAPKATCSNAACPSGYKAKTSAKNTKCPGDAASCVAATHLATCCDVDLTTCGGNFPAGGAALTCAAGFYDERTFHKTQLKRTPKKQVKASRRPLRQRRMLGTLRTLRRQPQPKSAAPLWPTAQTSHQLQRLQ